MEAWRRVMGREGAWQTLAEIEARADAAGISFGELPRSAIRSQLAYLGKEDLLDA